MGILLPEFKLTNDGKFYYNDLPARLADNVKTGYAKVYLWSWITSSESNVKTAIQDAFEDRIGKSNLIANWRKQLTSDLCS